MSFMDRVTAGLRSYKPVVREVLVTSIPLPCEPLDEPPRDASIWHKVVRSAGDPHLRKIEDRFRQRVAPRYFRMGMWCLLAIDGDEPIGKIWCAPVSMVLPPTHGPRVRLAADELFLFDLWIAPEYRRTGVALSMCNEFLRQLPHVEGSKKRWLHGFVYAENTPSRTLMERYGMWVSQQVKQLALGHRVFITLPFTGRPGLGPLTRRGRHSGHTDRVPGRPAEHVLPVQRPDPDRWSPEPIGAAAPPGDPGPDWDVDTVARIPVPAVNGGPRIRYELHREGALAQT